MGTHALRRVPVVERGQPVGMVSLGDLAVERDPSSALGDISATPPNTEPAARWGSSPNAGDTLDSGRNGGAYGGNAGRNQSGRTKNCAGTGAERGALGLPRGAAATDTGR